MKISMCICVALLKIDYLPMQCMSCHVGKQNLLSLPIVWTQQSFLTSRISLVFSAGLSCIISIYNNCIDKGISAI